MAVLLGFMSAAAAHASHADTIGDLTSAFRDAYRIASAHMLTELRATVPVLVNRFEQVALYRPGIEKPELLTMDATVYRQASAVAHTAATLATRLSPFGLGTLDEDRRSWLVHYQALLSAAEADIARQDGTPEALRRVQVDMLQDVRRIAQRIEQQGAVDQAILNEMGETVRLAIDKNLEAAAASQLEQFRAELEGWKAAYPSLAWDRAVVVIIGVHQARERNLQRQFFDWMLHDRPDRQDRVVFAETPTPPGPLGQTPPDDELMVLAKVMLDKDLASVIFGDPLALQSDVLGAAAQAIIERWR